jgi:ATP-dependent Clp endopeptidase proteolytic subunit ClpP
MKYIEFKNNADTQELYLYGDIVGDEWSKWNDADTCPQDVLNVLNQIDETKPLNIYINSGGGSVFGGLSIYNMLKRSKSYKTVYIDGLAGSIASVIAMCGDKIVIPSNAFLMIHKPLCSVDGNASDLTKMASDLDRIEEGILNVYAEKIAKDCDIETIKTMVANETWIVGSEASKYFNVEVVQSNKAVASISNLNNYNNVPKELKTIIDANNGCLYGQCLITDCTKCNNDAQLIEVDDLKAKLEFELLI